MSIQHIREKYRLPVKIGAVVRLNDVEVKVISSPGAHLKVRLSNGKKETRHPFDFDYKIDGTWRSGDELKREYDAGWDRFNQWLKENQDEPSANRED